MHVFNVLFNVYFEFMFLMRVSNVFFQCVVSKACVFLTRVPPLVSIHPPPPLLRARHHVKREGSNAPDMLCVLLYGTV